MDKTVTFRDFEERDIDFIYRCKNDEQLNSMIVGEYKPITYEDAIKWVHGCMGRHDTYKFWAVCASNYENKIIGWTSLSNINYQDHCACQHGIVIADPEYRDGLAMFETLLYTLEYAFTTLELHRVYGTCLSEHKISPHLLTATGFRLEGHLKDAIYKHGRYYDQLEYGILDNEYKRMKTDGLYEPKNLIKAFMKSIRSKKI